MKLVLVKKGQIVALLCVNSGRVVGMFDFWFYKGLFLVTIPYRLGFYLPINCW